MSADAEMPPRYPREVREKLADGTDITGEGVRSLVVRVANEGLAHGQRLASLERHVDESFGRIAGDLGRVARRLGIVEAANGTETSPPRDPDRSWHDFDAELARASSALRTRVRDPHDPLDEAKAKALVQSVVDSIQTKKKAARWDALTGWPERVFAKVVEGAATHVVTLLLGAGLALLWHFLRR